jgi:transposase, IS30 family
MHYYRRVTYEDRCQIQAFLQAKLSINEISERLGFHRSSIYREIGRNRMDRRGYIAGRAHELWYRRIRSNRRPLLITGELQAYIVDRLMQGWSPEQISGRLELEGKQTVSPPTIYRYVKRHWDELKACLRWYNKRGAGRIRLRRYKRQLGLSIYSRPEAANLRSRRGDWERDCFMVAKRKLVLVCTDRLSRYTMMRKVSQFSAKQVSDLTLRMLHSTGKRTYTITNDNGTEFRDGPNMKIPVYFCSPNKPQQRGTIENTIGLIRHYVKRDTDHETLNRQNTKQIENLLNHRPRKCLDYRTPHEVFFKERVALAI